MEASAEAAEDLVAEAEASAADLITTDRIITAVGSSDLVIIIMAAEDVSEDLWDYSSHR